MPANAKAPWTPENIALVRSMIEVEGLSPKEVAALTGRSRNAIMGIVWRAGIRIQTARPTRPPGAEPNQKFINEKEVARDPTKGPVTLELLQFGQCKWPVSFQNGQWMFCAEPFEAPPYCETHRQMGVVSTKALRLGAIPY